MGTRNFHWDPIDDCVLMETDQNGNTIVTYTHEPGMFGPLLSENRDSGWTGLTVDDWSALGVDDWASLTVSSPTEYYHHYDALGSTTILTDDSGAVTDSFQYDAWGIVVARTGTTATPYQWVGRWGYRYDTNTRSYDVRMRSYNAPTARWLSVDPIALNGIYARYLYCHNSAAATIDPSGLLEVSAPGYLNANPNLPSFDQHLTSNQQCAAPVAGTIASISVVFTASNAEWERLRLARVPNPTFLQKVSGTIQVSVGYTPTGQNDKCPGVNCCSCSMTYQYWFVESFDKGAAIDFNTATVRTEFFDKLEEICFASKGKKNYCCGWSYRSTITKELTLGTGPSSNKATLGDKQWYFDCDGGGQVLSALPPISPPGMPSGVARPALVWPIPAVGPALVPPLTSIVTTTLVHAKCGAGTIDATWVPYH